MNKLKHANGNHPLTEQEKLKMIEEAAEHFDADSMFTHKIKQDFIQIRTDIIQGEKDNETRNQMEKEAQENQRPCEVCDD